MSKQRILVTGAGGFIGSHVCEALLARGDEVVGLDNFDPYYARELKDRNVASVRAAGERAGSAFELFEGDILDARALDGAMQGVTGAIHLAAKAGVRPSIADPSGYARVNVLGTQMVLDATARAGVSRVVCASSSSVYGNNTKVPFSETDPVNDPISPYAATKRACELIAHTHHHLSGMPTAMLRFFTVYGPRQRPDLAINLFLRTIAAGEPIRMFGDGSMSRDYTYIDDIVGGVLSAYEQIPRFGYRVWNLGSDRPVRLDELIALIGRTVGREPAVQQEPMQPGDVERTWADVGRSKEDLGYRAKTSLCNGVTTQHNSI